MGNIFATTPQLISLAFGLAIFFAVILFAVLKDEHDNRTARVQRPENEWLFTNWDEKLYDCMSRKNPEEVLVKLGVNVEEYKKNNSILKRKEPNLKKLAADKYVGIFTMLFGMLLFAIAGVSGAVVAILVFGFGYLLYMGDVERVKKEANAKKRRIEIEMPRFLDLLQTALYIDIPVSDAIIETAKRLKNTYIAKELIGSIAESQMGSMSWQQALQDLAVAYDVDMLSDFVQYLINGYEKGLNIYDVVSRQAEETRKTALVHSEESANKLNSSILLPVAVFKLAPLVFIVGYPLVYQIVNGGLGF